MKYTTLNNNEIIPTLGIGTYRIRPTDAERSVDCFLYTYTSQRDLSTYRMPSSA